MRDGSESRHSGTIRVRLCRIESKSSAGGLSTKVSVRDKMDGVCEDEFTIDFERTIQAQDIVLAVMVIASLSSSVQFSSRLLTD